MYIKNLYTLNLEELYLASYLKQNEIAKGNKFNFGASLINLYNYVELTFDLRDVSIYEYMLLKRFSSRSSKLFNKHIQYESPDYSFAIHDYAKLIHTITKDESIVNTPIKYDYPYLYGPAFLLKGDCTVTLSGRELISIFDIDPATTFITATKGKCLVEQGSPVFIKEFDFSSHNEGYINLINFLKDKFARVFYNNFFIQNTTGSDLISESAINYYCSSHDKRLELFAISNPIYKYNIRRDNLNNITEIISGAKKKKDDLPNSLDIKSVIENTYVTFNIYSRFSTYLDLFENLPKEFFIASEDLKIPSNFREIYIPIEFYDKYHEKLEDAYTSLDTYIRNENRNFYVKYQCTYLNSMYAYSIKIKLDDVNKYINTLNRGILQSETKEILDDIIRYCKAVVKLFK